MKDGNAYVGIYDSRGKESLLFYSTNLLHWREYGADLSCSNWTAEYRPSETHRLSIKSFVCELNAEAIYARLLLLLLRRPIAGKLLIWARRSRPEYSSLLKYSRPKKLTSICVCVNSKCVCVYTRTKKSMCAVSVRVRLYKLRIRARASSTPIDITSTSFSVHTHLHMQTSHRTLPGTYSRLRSLDCSSIYTVSHSLITDFTRSICLHNNVYNRFCQLFYTYKTCLKHFVHSITLFFVFFYPWIWCYYI